MDSILVVAVDLGIFRAFRRVKQPQDSQAHLETLRETSFEQIRERWSEQLTDLGGRFPKAGSTQTVMGDMTQGERHNLELEQRRRALHAWAEELHQLLAGPEFADCWLAAAQPIHQQLLDALEPSIRQKIRKLIPVDLAGIPTHELLRHFE